TGVWFAVKGLQPASVTGLLPLLPVIGITPPQHRLGIPPSFHLFYSIFYPYHQASDSSTFPSR
ncbi:hypothetical protein Goshw_003298, partial [Gossypium schwendimanii]|nr:hypothetical protein [Gossypium schwendimanii]